MCGIVAQWLRFWDVNQETMGSNPAETIFFFFFVDMSTHSTNVEYCCVLKCVAKVATIFSLDRYETLHICFDGLTFERCDAVQIICR